MHQLIFGVLALLSTGFFAFNLYKIAQNIHLGLPLNRSDQKAKRWKTMLLVALGQKKMFNRPIAALLHLTIYAAFVITQIELIEIFIDGLSGSHRYFQHSLGAFYTFTISFIEILSILAFIGTLAFLARRNMLKLPRLNMKELAGWPTKDANLILIMEIVLIACIFTMNGADEAALKLHSNLSNDFLISKSIGPLLFGGIDNLNTLHILEQVGWWGHIIMVFAFMNYLPYSKHLHIFFAFPNTYYSKLEPKGQVENMPSVTNEVKLMLDPNADPYSTPTNDAPAARFGAKDITDLTWKSLMDAYSCTECGRCTSVCPANITGKLLSPRKIMMDTRDRMAELGNYKRKNGKESQDGKSLLGDYISKEELWACTTCNACVQECPINIDPLSIIIDLRRFLVMEEANIPSELTGMLTNIENNGAPWQFASTERMNWSKEE